VTRCFGGRRRRHIRIDVDADQATRPEPALEHLKRESPPATNIDDDRVGRFAVLDQSFEIIDGPGKNVSLPGLGPEKPDAEARLRYVRSDRRLGKAGYHADLFPS
jgi:hypothetical protein